MSLCLRSSYCTMRRQFSCCRLSRAILFQQGLCRYSGDESAIHLCHRPYLTARLSCAPSQDARLLFQTPILLRPHRSIFPVASRGPTARVCARELPKAKTPHSSFWTSRLETRHCSTWRGVPAGQPEVRPNSSKFLFPPIVQNP